MDTWLKLHIHTYIWIHKITQLYAVVLQMSKVWSDSRVGEQPDAPNVTWISIKNVYDGHEKCQLRWMSLHARNFALIG